MTTINISSTETINAPKSEVWALLSDFQHWHDWTSQIKTIKQTSEAPDGVGAGRHCELAPVGRTDEEILEWVPEDKLVVSLFNVKVLPVKGSTTTFTLKTIDDTTTEVTMAPEVEPKGGFLAPAIGKRLQKGLPKASAGLLADLKVAAEK